VDRLQPAGRHYGGRHGLRPGPRGHGQFGGHQTGPDLVPPHRTRSGVHDDQRRRHRIHPRKRTHTYSPTGLPRGTTTEAVAQPFRYTGASLDPTGLYKMGANYGPWLGRFTQPDPSGQEINPYLYAGGDLVSRTDSSGEHQCRAEHRARPAPQVRRGLVVVITSVVDTRRS